MVTTDKERVRERGREEGSETERRKERKKNIKGKERKKKSASSLQVVPLHTMLSLMKDHSLFSVHQHKHAHTRILTHTLDRRLH